MNIDARMALRDSATADVHPHSRVNSGRRGFRIFVTWFASASVGISLVAASSFARPRVTHSTKGNVTLPYRLGSFVGGDWIIYQGGSLRQQSNMPMFNQCDQLMIDGNSPNQNNNQARLDDNGEIVIENMQVGNLTITRRFFFNVDQGYFRVIDQIKNTQAQDQTVQYSLQNQLCYGIKSSTALNSPSQKGDDIQVGVVVEDGQSRNLMMLCGGRGSKVIPNISSDQNNNMLSTNMSVTIPANKEVAVMHICALVANSDAALKLQKDLRDSKLLANVSRDIKRELVNFAGHGSLFDDAYGSSPDNDFELLRGDLFDVVELRGGDQYKGTLSMPDYKLDTAYGMLDLPADRVIGMFNIGQSRPRQLVVTQDGQIFGGRLQGDRIPLQLTGGQSTQVPLNQISRIGYRSKSDDADTEWTYAQPMLFLRAGDRIAIARPKAEITVATRYGMMHFKPESIASLNLANANQPVHEIILNDGSHFAGLLTADSLELTMMKWDPSSPAGGPASPATAPDNAHPDGASEPAPPPLNMIPGATAEFPVSSIARLQFNAQADEVDDMTSILRLANEDLMVGALSGPLKLDTPFDTLNLKGEQVKGITPVSGSATDVQIRMWDDTSVSGQLESGQLDFKLRSGLVLKVPLSLVVEYRQPYPAPSEQLMERVKGIVVNLNSNDWKQRDRAQAELTQMGPAVLSVLKELRASQPEESQQRIDEIISALKGSGKGGCAFAVIDGAGGRANDEPSGLIKDDTAQVRPGAKVCRLLR